MFDPGAQLRVKVLPFHLEPEPQDYSRAGDIALRYHPKSNDENAVTTTSADAVNRLKIRLWIETREEVKVERSS